MMSIPVMDTVSSPSFSYAESAKRLRLANTTPAEKLQISHHLLSHPALTPNPSPLLLAHVIYQLTSPSLPHAHLEKYWMLLHDVLCHARATAQPTQTLPDSLLSAAAVHLNLSIPSLIPAVSTALNSLLDYQHTQNFSTYARLLHAVAVNLPSCPYLEPLAVRFIHAYQVLLRRENEPKPLLANAVTLLPVLIPSTRLRPISRHFLSVSIFADPHVPRAPLQAYLSTSQHPSLPSVVSFLLHACSRFENNRPTPSHNPPNPVRRILAFFREILASLSSNLSPTSPGVRVAAVESLFVAAHHLSVYRPSYDDLLLSRAGKKRSASGESQPGQTMAQFIKLVFVQLIDVLHTEDHTVAHAAMRSAAAIATLSLDTVDEYVGELLQACGELKTSCREDIELARRNLVSSLIVTYARTRSLPFLMERLARPTPDTCILAAYAPVLRHCDVQKILASTVHALPHGQAVSCVSALIPSCLETPHAPCLSFLIALILETSEASQQAAVVREACSSVLPKIASLPVSVKIQSSAAFLLSSVLFALIRVDIPLDDEILKIIIESGIVQATGTLTFPREEVNESMFAIRLVESISHMGLVEDESLCFCIIRLLAVIAHFMVRQSVQDVNRDLMGKAFDEIFKRYEALISLCTGKNPKLHDSLFHGPSILDSTIPVIGSIIDMLHFTPTLKDVSSGFVMFISYAAEHFQPGHLLWQDLIERKFVQNSFADAVCTSLSRYSKAETQSPYPSNKVEAILKLIQAIPRGYVLETDEERIALAICSLHNFLEERSKEEAVRALLGLRIPCLVKAEDIFRSSVERGPHDSFLAKLVKAIEVKRLPEKKGQRLICSLLVSWSDGSQLLGRASSLLANVDIMVQDSANEYVPSKSVKTYSPEKKVTKRVLKLLPDIKRTYAKALTESEEQMERVNGLRIAGSLMRLHASIEQEKGIILALPELFEQLRTASAAVLRDCFEIALSCCAKFLQNYDDSNGIKHEMMDASHFFLSSLWCNGHKPVYHHFLSQVERIFFLSRIMASSIHFLSNKNAGVRTIGVEALCDIGSFEDKDVVQELGLLILSQIESEEECFDSIGCSMSAEEANNVLADCKRIRARVLGCASILCGCRLRSEDKVVVLNEDKSFGHFKEVRLRRDLSGIRLKRDISSRIMLQVLQKCSLLLRVISSIRALSGEIQEARDRQIKKVRNVVWFCVRLCMQACETCFSRQVPYRFDNMDVQEMLVSLTGLLRCIPKGDKFSEVHEEEVLVRMTRVCKCIMQHHASVGRWGTSGLLGTILKRGVMLESCEVAKGVGDVFEEFGRIGSCAGQRHAREVVCAVLANASESVVGVSTVEFRRALAPGMMALVKSIGENAARGILARLGDGGREVLKQVWELYVGEYQYRGK